MKEKLKELQAQLVKATISRQALERDYKEIRSLLERSMAFSKHIKTIERDYNTLLEREKLGLRG